MSKERQIISISISLTDELEIKLLEHLKKRTNVSKYLKRLIYDDLMNIHPMITATTHPVEEDDEDIDAMKGFF